MTTINAIIAEALDHIATKLETAVELGTEFNTAVQELLTELITDHGSVVFNGNGYSDEWQVEAAERGLPNLRTTLDALPELIKPEAVQLFGRYGIFNESEAHSRYEIGLEHYTQSIHVEALSTLEIGQTSILPAGVRYQTELAANVTALTSAGIEADMDLLHEITTVIGDLRIGIGALRNALAGEHGDDAMAEATYAQKSLLPAMASVRAAADALEAIVADDLWPLPTYQEMLYIL